MSQGILGIVQVEKSLLYVEPDIGGQAVFE